MPNAYVLTASLDSHEKNAFFAFLPGMLSLQRKSEISVKNQHHALAVVKVTSLWLQASSSIDILNLIYHPHTLILLVCFPSLITRNDFNK